MPWFYVDDAFADSKPVMRLDASIRNAAVGLWVRCGAWSAKEETDGRVPLDVVRGFNGTPRLIRALHEQAELWAEESPESWRESREILFGNWSKWQKTHAELLAKRQGDAERQRRSRGNRKTKGRNAVTSRDDSMSHVTDGVTDNVTGGVTEGVGHASVTCDPHARARRPDPTRPLVETSVGVVAVGSAAPAHTPSRFCAAHPNGTAERCGDCANARVLWEQAQAEEAQRRAEADAAAEESRRRRRALIDACDLCDDFGRLDDLSPCEHPEVSHA